MMLQLATCDGNLISVRPDVVQDFQGLQSLISDCDSVLAGSVTVDYDTLENVISWCTFHHDNDSQVWTFTFDPREEAKSWDRKFAETLYGDSLLKIIIAADGLDIPEHLELCCFRAAGENKRHKLSSRSLANLPQHLQLQIVDHMTPHSRLSAASEGGIYITEAQKKHAEIWASVIKEERWFEEALFHGANPFLVSPEFSNPTYLVLITPTPPTGVWDWDCGDIVGNIQNDEGCDYDEGTGEVVLKDTTVLNIWQPKHKGMTSRVVNLEDRLIRNGKDGEKTTAILFLQDPTVHHVTSGSIRTNRRFSIRCFLPGFSRPTTWNFVDSTFWRHDAEESIE